MRNFSNKLETLVIRKFCFEFNNIAIKVSNSFSPEKTSGEIKSLKIHGGIVEPKSCTQEASAPYLPALCFFKASFQRRF